MAVVLVDTNVLVYAHDRGEPAKQEQAIRVLDALEVTGNGRLTAQVLGEFFRATTKPPALMLTQEQAQQQIDNLVASCTILDTTAMVVQEAVRGVRTHHLSYYDAQVWAAARLNQVGVIFSEDFAEGSPLEGVRFVNPFAAEFALEAWAGP
jgi:predicted nucleic acid-binding protein